MTNSSFDESNGFLNPPEGISLDECETLSIFRGTNDENGLPVVITCWKMTKEEFEELKNNGGRVWLIVLGKSMPPVYLSTIKPEMKSNEQNTGS